MTINRHKVTVTGNDSEYTPNINGQIVKIFVDYGSSADGGTDVTLDLEGPVSDETILSLTDNNTDGWYYPHNYAEDTGGTDLVYASTDKVPVPFYAHGRVKCTVAQIGASDRTVTFHIYYAR